MGTKTISIMDDAYELLVRHKKPNESFSEEIRRLVPKKGNIMECAGLWADMSDKETWEMEKTINRLRKNSTKSLFRRVEEL
ncbi:antitoxin VapB family protein [Candidatus Woesearchaeota archaeon]|nr:antitoxin VapB family protein [Candidatus Woesearchaeota archaeon]